MNPPLLRRCAGLALFLWLPLVALGQGLTWETTTTLQLAGEHKVDTRSMYLPRMFKQASDKEATIFRLDKQTLYTIDYAKKQYSEMTFAELEAFVKKTSGELEQQMAEMKKQLAGMPEDQRKVMEGMMGKQFGAGGKAASVEVTKSTETKPISGYACAQYLLKEEGKEIGAIWTTTGVPGYSAMQKDFTEFSQRLASQMTVKGPEMADAMQKVEGFPVQTTIGGMTSMVTKISKAAVAASEFEVPAGFKKVPFMGKEKNRRYNPMNPSGEEGDEGEE